MEKIDLLRQPLKGKAELGKKKKTMKCLNVVIASCLCVVKFGVVEKKETVCSPAGV